VSWRLTLYCIPMYVCVYICVRTYMGVGGVVGRECGAYVYVYICVCTYTQIHICIVYICTYVNAWVWGEWQVVSVVWRFGLHCKSMYMCVSV